MLVVTSMLASFRSIYRPALSCASHPSIVRASSPCLISRSAYKSIVIPRRSFYGHISDPKMAPNLEPYFKQYVQLVLCISNDGADVWTAELMHKQKVS